MAASNYQIMKYHLSILLHLVLRSATLSTAVLLAVAPAALAQPHADRSRPQDLGTLSIKTRIVSLTVSVTDQAGRHHPGLDQKAFTVYEDGVAQEILHFSSADGPASIGIVFDMSGSMKGKKFEQATRALERFIKTTHQEDLYSLVSFNDQADLLLDSVKNAERLLFKVTGILPRGNTALYDAVALGLRQVTRGRWPKQALIVITDGQDNNSRLSPEKLRRMAEETGVPIQTIVMKDFLIDKSGQPLIAKLSEITGGRSYFPTSENDLTEAFEQIALDLRHQYSIGYVPASFNADGKWRRLKVKVASPSKAQRLTVRNREGYYATADALDRRNEREKQAGRVGASSVTPVPRANAPR